MTRQTTRQTTGQAAGQTTEGVARRPSAGTRLERVLGVPLSEDCRRQWPQSGEVVEGRDRIAEVESHFEGLRLAVGRRHRQGDTVVVEWSTDYGDGQIYRNVSVAEVRDGRAVRVTDYWGAPFSPPPWRTGLTSRLSMPAGGTWPSQEELVAE